jgi:tetratricopeptide (TPR) repeat protein
MNPQAETVKVKLAKVHLETGNAKLALAEIEAILSKDTDGYWKDEALWVRARALESLGREKQALKAFAEFARLYPHDGQPYTGWDTKSYAETYAGYLYTSPRPAGKSPYTDYALGKIGLHDESVKNYVEALKIYLDMDDVADASDLLENKMPIPDMEKFAAKYPDHPALALVKYSTGIRYFRARNYDQALLYLGTDPKAQDVKDFRKMLGDLESLKDPGERARAEYKMAQYFFHSNRSIFTNDRLPGGQWMAFGAKSAPATGQDPGALFLSNDPMGSAAQEFKHVAEAYPDSAFAPRALYSYALCLLRHPDLKDPEGKTFVDKFRELAEKYPLDTLSDDALLWAYFFGRDDKDLAALAKNPNHGDVMLFFNTESMRKEYGQKWDYPHWWQMFYKHNEYLSGTDLTDEPKAALLGSQLDDQYNQGGPYSGWYYYKATGKEPYDATLNLALQGADDSDMTVNFNGREQTLGAHTPKAFHFKVAGLPPGVAQWINFRVAEASAPSISVSGSIQAQVDGQPYESPLDPVTAVSHAVSLSHDLKVYKVDPECQVETAFALTRESWRNLRWAFKRNDGKTEVYNFFGKYMDGCSQVVDEEIHQFLTAENGAEIHVGDLSQALAKDKPVAVCRYYSTNPNGPQVKPLFPLPPYGRYAHGKLSVVDGQLVDERGEAVADLPDELKTQATPVPGPMLRRRQRLHTHPAVAFEPQVEIKPGEPGNDQHLVVWGLGALGLEEDSRSCYPGPEKVTEAHYLGVDHAGNLYFFLRTPADDKVQVFYPNGKSLGLFWLKDLIGRVDDFGKLKYEVFSSGKVRFASFIPDQKTVHYDEFFFDHVNMGNAYEFTDE